MTARDIFADKSTKSRWVIYRAELHAETLVGGIPKDQNMIRGWLKAKLELGDVELAAIVEETLETMAWATVTPENMDEILDSVMLKTQASGNSFKKVNGSLVYEGRCLKAALKEAANVAYPGTTRWPGGPSTSEMRKGLKSYMEERVEVADTYIPLGRSEPDIVSEQRIKHVSGPQGKRSAINSVDVCTDVKLEATIHVQDDCLSRQVWLDLWECVELGGIGADRARGDGRCQLVSWARVD